MMAKAKDTASILTAAAELIEPRERWCHRSTARERLTLDATATCLATSPNAIQWGGTGAIYKVGRERGLSNNQCWDIACIVAERVGVAASRIGSGLRGAGTCKSSRRLREAAASFAKAA